VRRPASAGDASIQRGPESARARSGWVDPCDEDLRSRGGTPRVLRQSLRNLEKPEQDWLIAALRSRLRSAPFGLRFRTATLRPQARGLGATAPQAGLRGRLDFGFHLPYTDPMISSRAAMRCLSFVALMGCSDVEQDAGPLPPSGGYQDAASDSTGESGAADSATESGCVPKTCSQLGAECGEAADGCGATLECGDCQSGQHCGGAGPNACGTAECVPKTCAQLGASCGLVSDTCSAVLNCGACVLPETCGGGGIDDACGCTQTTCEAHSATCGSIPDGCGGQLACGSCSFGTCVNNQCECTPSCAGKVCGDGNGCGQACASGSGCRSASLDFGGAFGYVESTLVPNPATGAGSCPAGYAATKVRDTTNQDWPVVFCLRVHTPDSEPIYDFGGMWGYVEGVVQPNPVTGAESCPAGYTKQTLNNTFNLDWPFYVCYKGHSVGTPSDHLLGGVWGYVNDGNLVPNPLTQAASCPADYASVKISGTVGTDSPIHLCW
jgi:hypothetical protein